MKKGLSIWSCPPGMMIKDSMRLAKNAGFEGIELALEMNGEISMTSKTTEMKDIRMAAKDEGLEIVGLATGLYWSYSHTSGDPEKRDMAEKVTLKQLELAESLGVDNILVVPGAVGVDFINDCEIVAYDTAYERALEAIGKLSSSARKHNVVMALENVWNKFLVSPLEFRDFIDSIGSENVKAYFDVGNVIASGYPEHWIKILGKRIKRVHFKDYRRSAGDVNGFVDLLSGDVNFPAVIEQLHEMKYNDFVTAEMVPPAPFYRYHSDQIVYNTSAAMDRILGRV